MSAVIKENRQTVNINVDESIKHDFFSTISVNEPNAVKHDFFKLIRKDSSYGLTQDFDKINKINCDYFKECYYKKHVVPLPAFSFIKD